MESKNIKLNIHYYLRNFFCRKCEKIKQEIANIEFKENAINKDFIIKNKKFWDKLGEDTDANHYVLSEHALGALPWSFNVTITSSLVAKALNAKILYVNRSRSNRIEPECSIQESFANSEFAYIDEVIADERDAIKKDVNTVYESLGEPEDILSIRYQGVPVGEQIYDSVIKYKHATVEKIDQKVYNSIHDAFRNARATQLLMKQKNIVAGVFTHDSCGRDGVMTRILLANKKIVYNGAGGLGFLRRVTNCSDDRARIPLMLRPNRKHVKLIEASAEGVSNVEKYFSEYTTGKTFYHEAASSFNANVDTFTDKDVFNSNHELNTEKKNIFVFLHAMTDDPHIGGLKLFRDFYDWFEKTLEFAINDKNHNWVFKQHPFISRYPDDANIEGIFKFLKNDNIIYINEHQEFNNKSLSHIADAVVTCGGTVGLEQACFGLQPLLAKQCHYSGFGFTCEPETQEQYFQYLQNTNLIKALSPEQILTAKIVLYIIYKIIRPSQFQGFLDLENDSVKNILGFSGEKAMDSIIDKIENRKEEFHSNCHEIINFIRSEPDLNEDFESFIKI